jgi:hypothetical protein
MSYESAPSTRLVATACSCCGRALRDAQSLARGIGPVCAEKYGADEPLTEEARVEANKLIYDIAARQDDVEFVKPALVRLATLGLARLAGFLTERLLGKPTVSITLDARGWYVVKTPWHPDFVETIKRIPYAARAWDKAAKAWAVAPTERAGLWAALRAAFCGERAIGPKGEFMVTEPVEAATPAPVAARPAAERIVIGGERIVCQNTMITSDDGPEPTAEPDYSDVPAEAVSTDGMVDASIWYRAEAEKATSMAGARAARMAAMFSGNFTAAEGTYNRDASVRYGAGRK